MGVPGSLRINFGNFSLFYSSLGGFHGTLTAGSEWLLDEECPLLPDLEEANKPISPQVWDVARLFSGDVLHMGGAETIAARKLG